ncbi:MAG: M28 family metallopeptidase [Fidelibacterota bacterium]
MTQPYVPYRAQERYRHLLPAIVLLLLVTSGPGQTSTRDPNFLSLPDVAGTSLHQSRIERILQQILPAEIEENLRTLVAFGTRHSLSDTSSDARGIGAARRWIYDTFKGYSAASGGRLRVEWDHFAVQGRRLPGPTDMVNVVAVLPGTHSQAKNRIYVTSGHYDSRNSDPMDGQGDAPGANDDGSGTVVVMELARVLSQYPFDATLVFMAVAGEEQGLYGSRHWAEKGRQQGLNVEAMITNDVVGGGRGGNGILDLETLRCFSAGPADSPHRQLARYAARHVRAYLPPFSLQLIFRQDRYRRGGDHMSFMEAGYPAVRLTEAHENYDHQHQNVRQEGGKTYGDLMDFVNVDYIANVARANAVILASLAMGPAAPRNVTITGAVQNDTRISWEHLEEGATYEVLVRETTAPQWQKQVPAGSGTASVLKGIAVDNYVFGVRAVNEDGFVSTVTVPAED